jgi:hypothetical protein
MAVFEARSASSRTLLWPSGRPHDATPYARSGRALKSISAEAAALPVLIEDESGSGNDQ